MFIFILSHLIWDNAPLEKAIPCWVKTSKFCASVCIKMHENIIYNKINRSLVLDYHKE